MFDALTAAVIKPDAGGPIPAAIEFSNANDKPVIIQFNPNACRDITTGRSANTTPCGGDGTWCAGKRFWT